MQKMQQQRCADDDGESVFWGCLAAAGEELFVGRGLVRVNNEREVWAMESFVEVGVGCMNEMRLKALVEVAAKLGVKVGAAETADMVRQPFVHYE